MDFRDIGAFLGFGSERFSVMKFQDIDVFGLRAGVRFLCEISGYWCFFFGGGMVQIRGLG